MVVEIKNSTSVKIDFCLARKTVESVLRKENKNGKVSLVFLPLNEMKALNKKFLDRKSVTDVLSFSEKDNRLKAVFGKNWEEKGNLGEIIVCPEKVRENSKIFFHSFKEELKKILIHGTLHLLGYNHEKYGSEAQKMERKEEKYIKAMKF